MPIYICSISCNPTTAVSLLNSFLCNINSECVFVSLYICTLILKAAKRFVSVKVPQMMEKFPIIRSDVNRETDFHLGHPKHLDFSRPKFYAQNTEHWWTGSCYSWSWLLQVGLGQTCGTRSLYNLFFFHALIAHSLHTSLLCISSFFVPKWQVTK